jgi:hypothetical protein
MIWQQKIAPGMAMINMSKLAMLFLLSNEICFEDFLVRYQVIALRNDKSIAWALPAWCYLYLLLDFAIGAVLAG